MKKLIAIVAVVGVVAAAGAYLNMPGQSNTAELNQTPIKSQGSGAAPLVENTPPKSQAPAGTLDGVVNTLTGDADREAQVSSELEVDSSSFDAEVIEASNIENAYDANKF